MPLKNLIQSAYRVKSYQVSGPAWLDSERFEIIAKLPEGASQEQVPEMLQKLLQERFGLKLHRETKELPIYALVVGKNGPKLEEVADAPGGPGPGGAGPGGMMRIEPGKMTADRVKMSGFVDMISVNIRSMTRPMRVPALRAYHAAPDPKVCVAYGACGCSGGIFHDLYGVWGGADPIVPIDAYIPGCPPTPPATIYGFAMALGILGQKLKATHHVQADGEHVDPRYPEIPLDLRIDVEREARRMAGYWHGRRIADAFLDLTRPGDSPVEQRFRDYLEQQDDPRLTEIFARLQEIYLAHPGGN